MLKPTAHNLKKLQVLLEEQSYVVRFEKGNFQSGYCLIENKKVAIVNKFFDTEGKFNCLLDILTNVEIDESLFSEKPLKVYKKLFPADTGKTMEIDFETNTNE